MELLDSMGLLSSGYHLFIFAGSCRTLLVIHKESRTGIQF